MTTPKILAFDTSTRYENITVSSGRKVIDSIGVYADTSHSSFLLKNIDTLLKRTDTPLSEIKAIIICGGPGSFTGLRIGFSIAKGLSSSLNIPFVSVSSLEALAYGYFSGNNTSSVCQNIITAFDAGKNQLYGAAFTLSSNNAKLKRLLPDKAYYPQNFFAEFQTKYIGIGDLFQTGLYEKYYSKLAVKAGEKINFGSSRGAVLLGMDELEQRNFAAIDIEPNYLRKPESEL